MRAQKYRRLLKNMYKVIKREEDNSKKFEIKNKYKSFDYLNELNLEKNPSLLNYEN
jgi:hypothetical protein